MNETITITELEDAVGGILENVESIHPSSPACVETQEQVQAAIDTLRPVAPKLARALDLVLARHIERLAMSLGARGGCR